MRNSPIFIVAILTTASASLCGCAAEDGPALPPGWEGSRKIEVVKTHCVTNMHPDTELLVATEGPQVTLTANDVLVSCEVHQADVEAYLREGEQKADLLIRWESGYPLTEVPCMCGADFVITFSLPAGRHVLNLYTWGHWQSEEQPDPRLAGGIGVTVQ